MINEARADGAGRKGPLDKLMPMRKDIIKMNNKEMAFGLGSDR
jgi:hypothetical protein